MFDSNANSCYRKLLKDANFFFGFLCVFKYVCVSCAGRGRCSKTEQNFIWVSVDRKYLCGHCILTTKKVLINYYDIFTAKLPVLPIQQRLQICLSLKFG